MNLENKEGGRNEGVFLPLCKYSDCFGETQPKLAKTVFDQFPNLHLSVIASWEISG